MNNMFSDYALVSRAVHKLVDRFERDLVFSARYQPVDDDVHTALHSLAAILCASPLARAINEAVQDAGHGAAGPRTSCASGCATSRLMSCVGCERQTMGYGSALKTLLRFPEKAED